MGQSDKRKFKLRSELSGRIERIVRAGKQLLVAVEAPVGNDAI